jgi:DNA-binding transcriptional ArsR family regulator
VAALLGQGLTVAQLVTRLGYPRTTLLYHIQKLEAANVVEKSESQLRLQDTKHVAALLAEWRPPQHAADRFFGFWNLFYRRRKRHDD